MSQSNAPFDDYPEIGKVHAGVELQNQLPALFTLNRAFYLGVVSFLDLGGLGPVEVLLGWSDQRILVAWAICLRDVIPR